MVINRVAIIVALSGLCVLPAFSADNSFDFTLPKHAVTSAGVYDADGRLVRVLWTMQKLEAGKFSRAWDGKDDLGHDAPAGSYTFKVVANRARYANVGAIGNSGLPPDAHNHTPTHIAAIAVDDEGSVYSANGWDEAGADFKKWDKDGKSVFDANFCIRNGHPNGAPYAIAVDDKYIYCSVGGWANAPWNEAQQIQRFSRTDGKPAPFTKTGREDGHIQVYEWPSKMIPPGTSEADAELMKLPLRGIAVDQRTIYCTDVLGGRVIKFDKATGEKTSGFKVDFPTAIAVEQDANKAYLIYQHHHLGCVTKDSGQFTGELTGIDNGAALALQNGQLYVADAGSGQVKIFESKEALPINGDLALHNSVVTIGTKARAGDRRPGCFFRLTGVAADREAGIIVAQDEPYGGARLAKFSRDLKLPWEHFGCEFVSLGNYGIDNPDAFYSMTFHDYRLLDRNAGKWEYTGNGSPFPERKFISDVHGTPRVIKLGDHSFYFLPSGDGVQIYRVDDGGKVFHLAALIGGRSPAPDGSKEAKELGQWTWHDIDGKGEPKPEEINWFKKPGEGRYSCFGIDLDAAGNIIFANTTTQSIWTISIGPFDAKGNPTYDWKDAKEVVAKDTSSLKFEPNMVQRAEDGTFYAFGWSAAWPQPKNNPFWMGGTTLACFDKSGKVLWAVPVPKLVVGLDVIPGGKGGCFVGEGDGAKLDHYSADGLLIGTMQPGEAMAKQTGWLDNHASVAVNRDPRDHVIDVFAEDDYVLRIGWYRVDDRDVEIMVGKLDLKK